MSIETKLKPIKWTNIVNFNINMLIPTVKQEGCLIVTVGLCYDAMLWTTLENGEYGKSLSKYHKTNAANCTNQLSLLLSTDT